MHAARRSAARYGSVRLTCSNRFLSRSGRISSNENRADDLVGASVLSLSFSRSRSSLICTLSLAYLSLAPTNRVSCCTEGLFTSLPRTFPFYRGGVLSNLIVLSLSRSRFSAISLIRPFALSFPLTHTHTTHIYTLSLSFSLSLSIFFRRYYSLRSPQILPIHCRRVRRSPLW